MEALRSKIFFKEGGKRTFQTISHRFSINFTLILLLTGPASHCTRTHEHRLCTRVADRTSLTLRIAHINMNIILFCTNVTFHFTLFGTKKISLFVLCIFYIWVLRP